MYRRRAIGARKIDDVKLVGERSLVADALLRATRID